jgi:hypothetical protein
MDSEHNWAIAFLVFVLLMIVVMLYMLYTITTNLDRLTNGYQM